MRTMDIETPQFCYVFGDNPRFHTIFVYNQDLGLNHLGNNIITYVGFLSYNETLNVTIDDLSKSNCING